jgi:hypothetical protein
LTGNAACQSYNYEKAERHNNGIGFLTPGVIEMIELDPLVAFGVVPLVLFVEELEVTPFLESSWAR